MAAPVYVVTFTKDYPPYSARESAAFTATIAAELFARQLGTLTSGDQIILATQIAAAQAVYPVPNQRMRTEVTPDGLVVLKPAVDGQPILYGTN